MLGDLNMQEEWRVSSGSFEASVQYDDFTGTAAADRADQGGLEDWLRANGRMGTGDFLVGFKFYTGERIGSAPHAVDTVEVEAVIADGHTHDTFKASLNATGPVPLRCVNVTMHLTQFFGMFKRFAVSLSNNGMLTGRDVDCI